VSKSKQTNKSTQKPANELSEQALDKASGGSFSWGMQNVNLCDGSVRPATNTNPGALLPAVQKTSN
jgi:hypothetical protein